MFDKNKQLSRLSDIEGTMASTSFRNGEFYNSVGLQASDETSSLEGTSIKIQRQASSFAVKDVKKLEMPPINSESKTPIHSSNEVDNDEKGLLKKIDDAWQRKDLQGMFQLIEVSVLSLRGNLSLATRRVASYYVSFHLLSTMFIPFGRKTIFPRRRKGKFCVIGTWGTTFKRVKDDGNH